MKLIKIFSVSKPEKYTNKEGKEKVKWYKVGTIKEYDNGTKFLKLYFLEKDLVIFEEKGWKKDDLKKLDKENK